MINARSTYMDASIATASPARLLVMLYERLVLDVTRGLDAQRAGDVQAAHQQLLHAQDIVLELRSSLRTEEWDGGPGLASIYDFLHTQLVRANVGKDSTVTESCLALVTDLCQTWRAAALQAASVA
ncbi:MULTISPECIES: flagellar export chaperone FliS [Nocardioides]|uniref:Flagellar export chaperone FliS n=1 Tax=Nocardioides kribbensis TaxID=305517 RepID=A0ABV1NX72_9ACTN|nr:flagellar export chaperone FliS [Nocardioides sp. P86]MBJ7530346.1 flagellar export chaperone FliS [Nocardioides sp.]MCM3514789.1 flagellar export chaperone FliS [Nocardioides sp. P86]